MRALVPLSHVQSVPRSIEFYGKLGFRVVNTFQPAGEAEPTWAYLVADGGAQLMLGKATEPVIASQQAVLFYLYCDDVAAKHAELQKAGITVGTIASPFYAPRGEFRVEDPDGYVLMVTHT
jgi:catechol 2,3-dioxygenase-like lactoylglutathione lyase family enzyme